jgi:hypothetical protein
MRPMLRRILVFVCAALVLAAPAQAAQIIIRLTLVPGKLAVKAEAASATAGAPVQVRLTLADGRGSGAGWTLRVSAARAVTVTAVSVRCAAGSTCTPPKAVQQPSGSVVLEAARNTGMGVMNLVVTVAGLPAGAPSTPLSFSVS